MYGLHGMLWGEGNGRFLSWSKDAKWLVVKVNKKNIADINQVGRIRFKQGVVVFCGNQKEATDYIAKWGQGKAIIGHTATAGDDGSATAGYNGTATAGYKGSATAGYNGIIQIKYWDGEYIRFRIQIGYIGENGLEPNVHYKLNNNHEFEKTKEILQ